MGLNEEDKEQLRRRIGNTQEKCRRGRDLLINDARFYPGLGSAYADLVSEYTAAAQCLGVRVHNGMEFLKEIQLRDDNHCAAHSTQEVVAMIVSIVLKMVAERPFPPEATGWCYFRDQT